jgi:hypothetical protein
MGLLNLPLEEWIEIDGKFADELRLKRQLLAEKHDACFLSLPGSEAGGAETLELLAAHLPARFPETYARDGDTLVLKPLGERWDLQQTALHPLDLAARLVQEDLCLMRAEGQEYVLAALSVCFPSRWEIAEKLGKPLRAIHGPVAFYDEKLAKPVDRFFTLLKEDKPVQRLNWNLLDDSALFLPGGHNRKARNPRSRPRMRGSSSSSGSSARRSGASRRPRTCSSGSGPMSDRSATSQRARRIAPALPRRPVRSRSRPSATRACPSSPTRPSSGSTAARRLRRAS